MIWSTMPGSSRPVFAPYICIANSARLNSSITFFQDRDEHDVFSARMLQLLQPCEHFSAVQAVSSAHVFSARAIRESLWLLLAPTK